MSDSKTETLEYSGFCIVCEPEPGLTYKWGDNEGPLSFYLGEAAAQRVADRLTAEGKNAKVCQCRVSFLIKTERDTEYPLNMMSENCSNTCENYKSKASAWLPIRGHEHERQLVAEEAIATLEELAKRVRTIDPNDQSIIRNLWVKHLADMLSEAKQYV